MDTSLLGCADVSALVDEISALLPRAAIFPMCVPPKSDSAADGVSSSTLYTYINTCRNVCMYVYRYHIYVHMHVDVNICICNHFPVCVHLEFSHYEIRHKKSLRNQAQEVITKSGTRSHYEIRHKKSYAAFKIERASCRVLSCLVLSCLVLSCLVLSCLVCAPHPHTNVLAGQIPRQSSQHRVRGRTLLLRSQARNQALHVRSTGNKLDQKPFKQFFHVMSGMG